MKNFKTMRLQFKQLVKDLLNKLKMAVALKVLQPFFVEWVRCHENGCGGWHLWADFKGMLCNSGCGLCGIMRGEINIL